MKRTKLPWVREATISETRAMSASVLLACAAESM